MIQYFYRLHTTYYKILAVFHVMYKVCVCLVAQSCPILLLYNFVLFYT